MKVICAGISKTGTKSLAKALRILGFNVYDYFEHRSFHMNEWFDILCQGKTPDFTSMYKDVDAVTDIPPAIFFQEIYEAFPDAKVILSLRDNEEVWVQSWAKQLEAFENGPVYTFWWLTPILVKMLHLVPYTSATYSKLLLKRKVFLDTIITAGFGSLNGKSTVLLKKKYREHNERVQAVIPKEKLLIYNVKQGWKPLCEFLECNVPDQEFPRENVALSLTQRAFDVVRQEFKRNVFILLAIVVVFTSAFYLAYF